MLKTIKLRIKQYGFYACFKRYVLFKAIELIYSNYENLVLIIPNHKEKEIDERIKLISNTKLDIWKKKGLLSKLDYNRYHKFITTNCIGYYIEIENEIAAIGFVQTKGTYKYGIYFYNLPNNIQMLKNLFVKPKFRGMSLGKKINEARINGIPESCIPCVFVIPENRYAIRNLKMFGFEEYLSISHSNWFKSFTKTTIKVHKKDPNNNLLIDGFQTK